METKNKQQTDIKQSIKNNLKNVDKKLVVLSNKGGVGKTTISVMIARILEARGKKVGMLDADVHGPSTLKALGMEDIRLIADRSNTIYPIEKGNFKLMSSGCMLDGNDTPLIWRGPMKSNLIRHFLSDVSWGTLDYLIIDSPPGTGDEPMSVLQYIDDLSGGVIVTTPQEIALLDSRKCVNFLKALGIGILGLIENMSGFICPGCKKEVEIFKKGGGEKAAKELGVPFLGSVMFDPSMVEAMDRGLNYVMEFPDSASSESMKNIVDELSGV